MTYANAPLTPQGRLRLVLRCQHRPIAHVAAEAGVARQTVTKWLRRYQVLGEAGLVDASRAGSPTAVAGGTHGRDSDQARTVARAKTRGARAGYVYLHSAVDWFSRLWPGHPSEGAYRPLRLPHWSTAQDWQRSNRPSRDDRHWTRGRYATDPLAAT